MDNSITRRVALTGMMAASTVSRASADDLAATSAQAAANFFSTKLHGSVAAAIAAGETVTADQELFSVDDGLGSLIYLQRTADGSVEVARTVTPSGLAASTGSTLIGTKVASPAAKPRTQEEKNDDIRFIQDFGGATDAERLQSALDDATGAGNLFARPGKYILEKPIRIREGRNLVGGHGLPGAYPTNDLGRSQRYLLELSVPTDKAAGAIIMEYGSSLHGYSLRQKNQVPVTAAAPMDTGWAIADQGTKFGGDQLQISNIMLNNFTNGIRVHDGGQQVIQNIMGDVYGCALSFVDNLDMSYVSRVHIWPFSGTNNNPMGDYCYNNAVAIHFGRCDGVLVDQVFAFNRKHLFHFTGKSARYEGAPWVTVTNFHADQCKQPILIEKANRIVMTGGTLTGAAQKQEGLYAVDTGPDVGGQVVMSDFDAVNVHGGIRIRSDTGTFRISGFAPQHIGAPDDVVQWDLVHEGVAQVFAQDLPASRVSGRGARDGGLWMNGIPLPDADIDITPESFVTPHRWASVPSCTSIEGGSRFALDAAVSGNVVTPVTDALKEEVGLFIMRVTLQFFDPLSAGIGPAQFYLRLFDYARQSDTIFPPRETNGTFKDKTTFWVPFLIEGHPANLHWQFVYGGGNAGCYIDVTGLAIFRASYDLSSNEIARWIHQTRPNTSKHPLSVGFEGGRRVTWGPGVPAGGTHQAGDVRNVRNAATGQFAKFQCIEAGAPGVWKSE